MYSEQVLEHFHHPRNAGEINRPTAVAEASNPVCGDLMRLWILVRGGSICEAKFKVQGCVPAVACGSWLTEAIKGKSIAEAISITQEQIEEGLGGLPPASRHASMLAIFALRNALEKLGPPDVAE